MEPEHRQEHWDGEESLWLQERKAREDNQKQKYKRGAQLWEDRLSAPDLG